MSRDGRLLSLYLGLVTSTMGFLQPFVPLYLLEAGLDKGQIGLVAGAGALLAIVLQPLLGRLSDRLDARRPFVALMATLAGIAYLLFPLLHGPWPFLVAVAVGANANMYMQGVGGVLVGRLAAEGKGGATYAAYRVWGSIGYVLVALVTGFMLRDGSLKGRSTLDPLFHFGPLLFFAVAALAYWLPDPKAPPTARPEAARVRMHPNLRRFLLVDFLYIVALYGASNFLSIFMKDLGATGLLLSCVFLPGVILEVLVMRRSGALSDRFGRRPVLLLSYLLLPFRLLLYAAATGPYAILAIQTLHGLNFGIVGAVAVAFVNDQAEHKTRGALQAQLVLVTATAGALGPALMGSVADLYGLRAMFIVAAGLAVFAALWFLLAVEESNPHAKGTGVSWLDRVPRRGPNAPVESVRHRPGP